MLQIQETAVLFKASELLLELEMLCERKICRLAGANVFPVVAERKDTRKYFALIGIELDLRPKTLQRRPVRITELTEIIKVDFQRRALTLPGLTRIKKF